MTTPQRTAPTHTVPTDHLQELHTPDSSTTDIGVKSRWGWFAGRGELGFVLLIVIVASWMLYGGLTMEVLGSSQPGPQFFPILISILLYIAAVAITVFVLRRPSLPDGEPHPGRGNFSKDMLEDLGDAHNERVRRRYSRYSEDWATYSDWKTVGMIVGGMIVFILILNPVGWILSATLLFWVVVRALGSKNTLIDIGVALLFASVIQLAFNDGLGLPLPPGFLEGLL